MKRRIIVIASILLPLVALFVFNTMFSAKKGEEVFTEVRQGMFEISVSNSGELLAEKSMDVRGPDLFQQQEQQRGGGGGGGGMRGGGGGHMEIRIMDLKIQDIVAEGTIVRQGDYLAQMDRSSYSNTLKDAMDVLKTYQTNIEMKVLDTAVTLTNLRDDIKNQKYAVEEAKITLDQSKYEPPATIRQAEIKLDKAKRSLEQKIKGYELRVAQVLKDINHEKLHLDQQMEYVQALENFLAGFTIKAPASGMVIYKKDRMGTKRKAGSNLNPFDNVVATLPDLSSMLSKVYVSEIEVSKVKPGQKVSISIDAFPSKAFSGTVMTVANIGEQLPNSDAKMFEVIIKVEGNDPSLRPSMTTTNKIIIKTYDNVVYVPTECVQAGIDSIPFVYEKNKTKQYVVVGDANDKNVIIEQGLKPGRMIYVIPPEEPESFRTSGEELVKVTRDRNNARRMENQRLTQLSMMKK
jgi:multidrug efflux pump subunit AcrA (membrane-fusion protein)